MAPFSAVSRPFNTHVTKIGLIDLDDLTKEDTRHTHGMWHHLLHHQRKGIAKVVRKIAFQVFSASMLNVEVAKTHSECLEGSDLL